MTLEKKLKQLLEYLKAETSKPLDNYNYETRLWSKGYRNAMDKIRNFILNILHKTD
ncbi:MAG TPA: hypothetical protein VIK86_10525 [Candidatus Paceibacterota bacterium]